MNSPRSDGLPDSTAPRLAAHRASRRHLIVAAAIGVFAHKGFADSSIQEIAEAAGVAPAAVYYHFSGKEELFDIALRQVMDASSAAAEQAWPSGEPGIDTVERIVAAVWEWTVRDPDGFRLLSRQLRGGATAGSRSLATQYIARHEQRVFDYFATDTIPSSRRDAAAMHAMRSLRIRTMIVTTIAVHPHRLDEGPLAGLHDEDLRAALTQVCHRIVKGCGVSGSAADQA